MVRITDNKEVKETVLAGLQRNKEKYGKRYCPCSLVRDDDTVCMCKEFREMDSSYSGIIILYCSCYPSPINDRYILSMLYGITWHRFNNWYLEEI